MLSVIAKVLTMWVQQIEGHFFVHKIGVKSKRNLHKREKIPLGKNENHEGDNKSPPSLQTNQSILLSLMSLVS